MSDKRSAIERKVDDIRELRLELSELEGGMRQMRLGAKHEYRFKEIWWRSMGYGGGWFHTKNEPMPDGIASKFYNFLASESRRVAAEINKEQAFLDGLPVAQGVSSE